MSDSASGLDLGTGKELPNYPLQLMYPALRRSFRGGTMTATGARFSVIMDRAALAINGDGAETS
jgi:hypothetical protein